MSSKLEGNLQIVTLHLNTPPEALVVFQIDYRFGLSETMQVFLTDVRKELEAYNIYVSQFDRYFCSK